MARRKKYTPLQREYRKQIARLRRYENQILKMGGALQYRHEYADMPKRVTKQSIAKLKKIKPKNIRESAEFFIDDEKYDFYEYNRIKQQTEEQFSSGETIDFDTEVNMVIDNFWDQINSLPKGIDEVFQSWFARLIYTNGKREIGYYLINMSPDLAERWMSTGYDYEATMILIESEIYNVLNSDEYKQAMEMLDKGAAEMWEDM